MLSERNEGTSEVSATAQEEALRTIDGGRPGPDLTALTAEARAGFGISCFWNTPVLDDPFEDARLVAARLRKYGGRRGWVAALAIDKALREAAGVPDGIERVPA